MARDQLGASIIHEDGAKMSYDILGARHLGKQIPIVLICGMSCLRHDWERLANELAEIQPVLLFDHRGMGDSTFSALGDERITIELYTRDLLNLLIFLQWKELAICGFSMGGVITQQLLLLPYHDTNPTPLPFRITHVFLANTLAAPSEEMRRRVKIPPLAEGQELTMEERKELARPMVESSFDEAWLNDPRNRKRFNELLDSTTKRSTETIWKQARAVRDLRFNASHASIPSTIPILVIYGQNDLIVPFSCSMDILALIPHAKPVGIGSARGQVPDLKYGHLWYEYFGAAVWVGVIEEFINGGSGVTAKL